MPVTPKSRSSIVMPEMEKPSPFSSAPMPPMAHPSSCGSAHCGSKKHTGFGHRIILTLIGVFIAYAAVFLLLLMRNEIKKYENIGLAPRMERTIRVEGEGKVVVAPTLAQITIGMMAIAPTVGEAQEKNTLVMNALIARLKALGISEADIQTANYTASQHYNYTEKDGPKLDGYEVSQSVTIKIRDLSKSSAVVALVGEVGATNVGALEFTVDDRAPYIKLAREKAIEEAEDKAFELSEKLGVRLVSVVSYDESEGGFMPMPMYARAYADNSEAYGGASPQIQSGTLDVILNVGVTYEIR